MEMIIAQDEPRISSVLVEMPVVAAAQRIAFPDVQQLRSTVQQVIIIKAIRLITVKVLSNGITTAAANMPLGDLQSAVATFYAEGWEKGKSIPLLVLNDMNDSDATTATTIPFRNSAPNFSNWYNLDWAQSYVQFANGLAASTDGVFIFDVQYLKANAEAFRKGIITEIKGPS